MNESLFNTHISFKRELLLYNTTCIQSHLFRERMMLKCERSQLKMNGFEKNEECQLVTGLFQAENILNF